jgi:uncharacterized Zn-binding protein involved in type VI secretion
MSDFSFILPTEITDAILQSTDVPEAEYDAWVGGTGVFAALGQTSRNWFGMAAAPNGDIYVCVHDGDIYKQTAGAGDFAALSQTSRFWAGMAAAPNGDIYACVYNGDIYKQTNGTGDFIALSQTSRNWRGMAAAPNGDIYACVYNGDIYKQTNGTGDFVALSQTSRGWRGMTADTDGNVYASVFAGDIYKQTGGAGNFVALSQTNRIWDSMAAAPDGDIYACVYGGDIYKSAYVPVYSQEDQVIKNHVIYESLTNNNKNNDPETDTTNWLEVGPTNRWACYDGTIGNQSTQAESMLYILAPGAVDAIALLNLESSSVEIDVIDNNDNLVTNGTAWTGATGTTQPTGWDKVGTPADYLIDSGMIKITTDAANEGCSQTIAVSAATEYQLLGKYKNTADDIAQIAILSFRSATGSVTQANMKLSAVDGTAFVDFSTANILTDYVPDRSKLTITDSAGKKLIGYIKAQGAGETYGSELVTNGDMETAAPNGDVYACVYGGDIYKQAGGTGDFVALGQTSRNWRGMAAASNGWAAGEATLSQVSDERDGGSGSYAMEVTQTGTLSGVAAQYSGPMGMSLGALYSLSGYVKNLDATSAQLSMYGSVGGYFPLLATTGTSWAYVSGTFTMQEALSLYCRVVNASPGGKKGRFDDVSLTQVFTPSTTGVTITSTPDGSTFNWATKEAGFNYNDASGYSYEIEYTFIDSHPYEIEYTSDILATTDLASSTVESVFSHVFTTPAGCTSVRISLMGKASGDIVWFDDVILAPTEYSETVTTGASKTDLVKLDLPKHANALLTVKITNTGGTAKVGEIIVGEKTIIGLVEYAPGFGIKSWSTKSVDTYGKITIVERGYSKWVKAPIRIAAADMDEVARVLSIYKDTPIIWVVNQNYTSMIVYGFYSDFAVVWPHLDYFLCNIELEGLT